ncbi:MAG: TetR/AcrR family transcriptional regulator [Kibdelosporangium sp.]
MSAQERRARERAQRHQLIIDTARTLAESAGWDAVTTRRLADEIEYSQPVLYSHFQNKEAIVQAVALDGFAKLAETLRTARKGGGSSAAALRRVARAYTDFALTRPALYDAMFALSTDLTFGDEDTPEPLRDAFGELRAVVGEPGGKYDIDTYTEVVWSALHGLTSLTRTGRLRVDHHAEQLELLLLRFAPAPPAKTR